MSNYLRFKNASWSMPFLFTNMAILKILYNIIGENHTIKYIYGAPICRWTGGRLSKMQANPLGIEKVIEKCLSLKTTPVFTFSNTSLKNEDLQDKFCNELLKIIAQYNCQVIIASDLLHNYIKNKYPEIKQVCSVINFGYEENKKKNELELINTFSKDYERVVIRPEFALEHRSLLQNIQDIGKIELLVNQNCARNCQNSIKHYKIIEKQIWASEEEQADLANTVKKMCALQNGTTNITNNLTVEEIEQCINAGVKNLKLQGRVFSFDHLTEELFKYYFSPEINKDEITKEINKYISPKAKDNQKQQLQTLFR